MADRFGNRKRGTYLQLHRANVASANSNSHPHQPGFEPSTQQAHSFCPAQAARATGDMQGSIITRAEGHLGGAIALSRGPAGVMLSLSKAEWLRLFCGSSSASFKIPLPSFHSCESSLSRVACSLGEVSTCAHTFSPGSTLPSLVPHSITKF